MKYTTEWFINKARIVHGDKYDYSKASYKNYYTPVVLVCPKHGEFSAKPRVHLHGCGCPECGREKSARSHLLTNEEYIEKARAAHSDRYDYSQAIYTGEEISSSAERIEKPPRKGEEIVCLETGKIYSSGREAADELGVAKTAVYNAVRKRQKCRGYSFVKKEMSPSL